ncbi:MAG: hypothetical protein ACRDOE_24485, partial [Streptosporangiaceae bacterium]
CRWPSTAAGNGVRDACDGNVHGPTGQSTRCRKCGAMAIERYWYRLGTWRLPGDGRYVCCDTARGCSTARQGLGGPDGCRYGDFHGGFSIVELRKSDADHPATAAGCRYHRPADRGNGHKNDQPTAAATNLANELVTSLSTEI